MREIETLDDPHGLWPIRLSDFLWAEMECALLINVGEVYSLANANVFLRAHKSKAQSCNQSFCTGIDSQLLNPFVRDIYKEAT